MVKSFTNSRGELTIQPERSGHYTFTFHYLSDSNYQKVALKGPSIDQVVHPPASADFYPPASVGGRARRRISSCSGSYVGVMVDLKVRNFFISNNIDAELLAGYWSVES